MQIYEITLSKKSNLDEVTLPSEWVAQKAKSAAQAVGGAIGKGAMDTAASKVGGALKTGARYAGDAAVWLGAGQRTAAGQQAHNQRKTFDTVYKGWTAYRQQLDKSTTTGQADPNLVNTQLLTFISKNLLNSRDINSSQNKNVIVGLAKEISNAPANKEKELFTKLVQVTKAPSTATTPTTTAVTPKDSEITLSGKNYRWLGAQWAEVNPQTGKAGKTAEKAIQQGLNQMAAKGQFAKPTGPGAGAATTPTVGDQPITMGGKKLDPKNPNDAKVIANMKAQGLLQEALDKELARLVAGLI